MSAVLKRLFSLQVVPGVPTLAYTVPGTATLGAMLKELNVSLVSGSNFGMAVLGSPSGMCFDAAGNMYIADTYSIRKMTPQGIISLWAGTTAATGIVDAVGTAARFNLLGGICIDSTGTYIYVADQGNNRIRRITVANATVLTIAGSGTASTTDNATGTTATISAPTGICISADNSTLFVGSNASYVRKISTTTPYAVSSLATFGNAAAYTGGVCVDPAGTYLYACVGVSLNYIGITIYRQKIADGTFTLLAGANTQPANGYQILNGYMAGSTTAFGGTSASPVFYTPANTSGGFYTTGMVYDNSSVASGGNPRLYFADGFTSTIRMLDLQTDGSGGVRACMDAIVGQGTHAFSTSITSLTPAMTNGYPGTSRTGACTALTIKNGSLYMLNSTHKVIQRLSLSDNYCHVFAFDAPSTTNPTTVSPVIDGSACSAGQPGFFDWYLVPNVSGAAGTLDRNLHCRGRSVQLTASQSIFMELNKAMNIGDTLYVEASTPGLVFEGSGMEAS